MFYTSQNTTEDYRYEMMRQTISGKVGQTGSLILPVLTTPNGKMTLQVYAGTNEDLSFISRLRPEGKTCLTVGSSCDQLLTLIMEGAETADLFDINFFAQDFFALKKQVVLHLPYTTAKAFLTYDKKNKYFMFPYFFEKIKKYLSPFEAKFWNEVIHSPNKMNFFRLDGNSLGFAPYLTNKANFERLRANLDGYEPEFYNLPFSKLGALNKRYDIVLLSNINEWYKEQADFINDLERLRLRLSSDALIQAGYIWGDPTEPQTYKALKLAYPNHISWLRQGKPGKNGNAIILQNFEGKAKKIPDREMTII